MNRIATGVASLSAIAIIFTVPACTSDADRASDNISKAAESGEVQRKIVGINGITDEPAFEVEGKCSLEKKGEELQVICKHGEGDWRRHSIGLSDNVFWVSTQIGGVDADEYRTRIIIKPENIIPDFDLQTS